MKYSYQAIDASQQVLEGDVEAMSESDATRVLEGRGLVPVRIERGEETSARGIGRLKDSDLIMTLFELVVLLRSGVSIVDAIDSQAASASLEGLRYGYEKMSKALKSGESFSTALRDSNLPLPEYLFQLVEAGEMTGSLAQALSDALDQMQYEHSVRNEIRNALIYPAILVASGIAAVALIFIYVVPKFSNLLEEGNELPLLAYVVLASGKWCNDNALLLLVLAAGVIGGTIYLLGNRKLRQWCIEAAARVPLIGSWLAESDTARWAKILGALLANRVPLVAAMELANQGIVVQQRVARLNQVKEAVIRGEALSEAMLQNQAVTASANNLIRVGEKSGQLPEVLGSVAALYEENMKNRTRQLMAIIEPVSILIIGVFIGLIIMGVILAITAASNVGI
jgi:general secretion pathway protein F